MNGTNSELFRWCLSSSPLFFALLASPACEKRVIGDADGDDFVEGSGGMASGGSVASDPATGGTGPGCPNVHERQLDDEWRSGTNAIEELAGANFEGYVRPGGELREGADIKLLFGAASEVQLIVGYAAPPPVDANKGFLCAWDDPACRNAFLKPGGTYPIYDARVDDGHVRFTFNRNGAYDPWCALQTPFLEPRTECSYSLLWTSGFETMPSRPGDTTPCRIDDDEVDCDWFFLATDDACACDAASCFPQFRGLPFDATYDPTDRTLEGVLGGYQVYLKRVDTLCVDAGEGGAGGVGGACGE